MEGFKAVLAASPLSWESSIMGQQRGSHHWLHYTWASYHIPYILASRHCPAPAVANFTNCNGGVFLSHCCRLLTGDMSVGMRWLFMARGGGVLNAWWVGEGCSMPHCSFSPQCQCRHKSHEFLQQYVSEAQNLQLIETKPTKFWEPFDPRLRDSCNMKML